MKSELYVAPVLNTISGAKCNAGLDVSELCKESIRGRDIVVINPYCAGGGDHELANKIGNIALEEGCRVTVVPVSVADASKELPHRNPSLAGAHTIGDLNNPMFIVSPVGILPTEVLRKKLQDIRDTYNFKLQDVMLVEEMDRTVSDPSLGLPEREGMLKALGFQVVESKKLGFSQGAIGYLPVDKHTVQMIKDRVSRELGKLLDGYNFSLHANANYNLAYISSDDAVSNSKVFINNTLADSVGDERDVNYIMVLRKLDKQMEKKLVAGVDEVLNYQEENVYDFPSLYSNVKIYVADTREHRLSLEKDIVGQGRRNVNIVLVDFLPKNIFLDFVSLSHSGMASGDQSLGEFLSLTGKVPYYDMQPWKLPLGRSLLDKAKEQGGDELLPLVAKKIPGSAYLISQEVPIYTPHINRPHEPKAVTAALSKLDKDVSAHTGDGHIRNFVRSGAPG